MPWSHDLLGKTESASTVAANKHGCDCSKHTLILDVIRNAESSTLFIVNLKKTQKGHLNRMGSFVVL